MTDVFYPILEFQNLISNDISDELNVYKFIKENKSIVDIKDKIIKIAIINKDNESRKNYTLEFIKSYEINKKPYSNLKKCIIGEYLDRDVALIFNDSKIPDIINNLEHYKNMNGNTINRKKIDKNIIIAIIIAIGLIVSTTIYAYSSRYVINKPYRVDKWTGTYQMLKKAD
jgi:hypothetical protein